MGSDVTWENGSDGLRKLWVFWLSFLGVGSRAVFWVVFVDFNRYVIFLVLYILALYLALFYTVTD
jgi:fumarate reductase subunit C